MSPFPFANHIRAGRTNTTKLFFLRRVFSTASSRTVVSSYFSLLHSSPSLTYLRHLHAYLLRSSLYSNVILSSKLILKYSRLGGLFPHALFVFHHVPNKNIYSWNIIIGEFSRSNYPEKAVELFLQMQNRSIHPDVYTCPLVLRACAAAGSVHLGTSTYGLCLKLGYAMNLYVGSALVFMYATFGQLLDARRVFDGMYDRDVVMWTSMLAGYAQHEEPLLGLQIYGEMVEFGVKLDGVVMVSLLLLCGSLGSLKLGQSVHGWCVRRCLVLNLGLTLGNALINMYVKCAKVIYSHRVFNEMQDKDVISWSAMILGYGLVGELDVAIELFRRMCFEATSEPNGVTFLGVLSGCAQGGRVDTARNYFEMMKRYGVKAELKHYACMVDCFGKAGLLEEAEKLIADMPMKPDGAVLGALVGGCRIHGNVEMGEKAAKKLIELDPDRSGYYMLLANIYAEAGQFDDSEKVRKYMRYKNVAKVPATSSI